MAAWRRKGKDEPVVAAFLHKVEKDDSQTTEVRFEFSATEQPAQATFAGKTLQPGRPHRDRDRTRPAFPSLAFQDTRSDNDAPAPGPLEPQAASRQHHMRSRSEYDR